MTQHGKLPPGFLFKLTLGHTCSSKPDGQPELPSEALTTAGKPSGPGLIQSGSIFEASAVSKRAPESQLVGLLEAEENLGGGGERGSRGGYQIRWFLMAEGNSPQSGQL